MLHDYVLQAYNGQWHSPVLLKRYGDDRRNVIM